MHVHPSFDLEVYWAHVALNTQERYHLLAPFRIHTPVVKLPLSANLVPIVFHATPHAHLFSRWHILRSFCHAKIGNVYI